MRDETGAVNYYLGIVSDITDRKKSEELPEKKERDIQSILDQVPDTIWTTNMNLQLTYVSPSITTVLGFTPEERLQQHLSEMVTPETYEKIKAILGKEIENERSGSADPDRIVIVEMEYCHKDGYTVWLENKMRAIRDRDGTLTGVHGVSRDISRRKLAEDALKESERKYRELMDFLPISIYEMDLRGNILSGNPEIFRMFGYEERDLQQGLNIQRLLVPDDHRKAYEVIPKILRGEKTGGTEFSGIRKDGSVFPFLNIASPIIRDNKPVGLRGAIIDLTKRQHAEDALRKSEKRLADIIEFLPDATLVIDREGTVIAWNRTMENLTGVQADDMLGKGNYEYALPFYGARKPLLIDIALHPELEDHAAGNTCVCRHGDTLYAELPAPDLSEQDVCLAATASVLRDTEGNITGAIECLRNETERKILETRLQQSEKMLSLSYISAGVSHEILNPVGIISLELQSIERMEALPRKAREEINVCMEQIQRIVAITENLKQFARMTKDVMAPDDLNDVIAQVVKIYASQMKIEGIVADVKYDTSIPPILLDRTKIEQVLINLFSNAKDAMEGKDEKFLAIQSRRIDTNDGPHAQIIVADRGTGIREKALRRIFDPFYTTREQGKGTGMGLSIAHGIISQHGGRIWAENNEWGGATFFIELPAQREKPHEQEK